MARIIRCPACGSLFRVPDDFHETTLACSACRSVFSADKAESVTVSDAALDARLSASAKPADAAATPAERGEARMEEIAGELSEFSSRAPEAAADTVPADMAPEPPRRSHALLWTLLCLIALCIIAAVFLLIENRTVVAFMPQTQAIYEKVCTRAPCPGFVWEDADAFAINADIEMPVAEAGEAEREMARRMPTVRAKITNNSPYPQRLPILELSLLDNAGTVMGQRVLEPADYGFRGDAAVSPGQSATVRLSLKTPLPYDAASAAVRAVPRQYQ